MSKLTEDNVPFVWQAECERAFQTLKQRLASEPVPAFPRLGETFFVDVDASDCAAGGVLVQQDANNEFHPVAYFPTAFDKAQQNWAPTTKAAFLPLY